MHFTQFKCSHSKVPQRNFPVLYANFYLSKESIQLHKVRVLYTAEVNSIFLQSFYVPHFSVNTKLLPNKDIFVISFQSKPKEKLGFIHLSICCNQELWMIIEEQSFPSIWVQITFNIQGLPANSVLITEHLSWLTDGTLSWCG